MKVYVVEEGYDEDLHVTGVYATPEAAMAAHPDVDAADWLKNEYGWAPRLDFGEGVQIIEYEVIE